MRTGRQTCLILLVLHALAVVVAAADPPEPGVAGFSPRGTVKQVRQAAARFSEPMVPLGDPRGSADPFEVTCPEKGSGRWVDSRQWVYDFDRDLPAGVRCSFRLRTGLQTLAGKAFTSQPTFEFSTGGPAIREATPRGGADWIDEEQAFLLVLDGAATADSVERHASFSVEGIAQRVGVRLITGRPLDAVVKSRYPQGAPGPVVVVLQARQRFPNGARVTLVWGKGIAVASGVETEQDQTLQYKVRPPFTASFECERENRTSGCVPVSPMRVRFSSPVPLELARHVTLRGAGRAIAPAPESSSASVVDGVTFKGPFPESTAFTVDMPPGMRDDGNRPLANAARFPLAVKTEAFPPLAKFPARFGIVELAPDAALPVTVRNLEPELSGRLVGLPSGPQGFGEWVRGRVFRIAPDRSGADILTWIRRVSSAGRDASLFQGLEGGPPPVAKLSLPKPAGPQPMEVIGIPLREAGFYVVELESPRLGASLLGKAAPMYVPAAALVTNLSVHLKRGQESSVVWVTALDTGRPVGGARVIVHDCAGKALWQGATDGQGIARIDRLPRAGELPRCQEPPQRPWAERFGNFESGLFVTAQTPDDLSFVHSSWDQGIEPWRWEFPTEGDDDVVAAHTILDRPLFRAGETVHMKHLLRRQTQRGFGLVPTDRRPTRLVIRHLGSDEKYEMPLAWDPTGIAEQTWAIPAAAKLGVYEIWMERPEPAPAGKAPARRQSEGDEEQATTRSWVSGRLQVQEFRVPLMRGTLRPPTEPQIAAAGFPVDVSVQYLAGGGASRQPAVVRAQVRPRGAYGFEGLEDWAVANGPLKEGVVRRGVRVDEEDGAGDAPALQAAATIQRHEVTLDAAGTARVAITGLPRAAVPQEALTELEFRDPSGEAQTVSARVPLWPARLLVAVRPEAWAASRESLRAQVAVVDVTGKPAAGVPVTVDLLSRQLFSHRKRLVGGFYAYDHVEEIKKAGTLCSGRTDSLGRLACEGKPPVDGTVVIQASAADEAGRPTAAHAEVWVAGSDDWWFEMRDSDRIDLLPERRRYEPGETARLQVRMPFREATALVTIEREGVIDAHVVSLSGKEPVVELPVKPGWAPNVFVSTLVVRGRVAGKEPTALVDLGRPAFKLGVAEIRVGWRAHELKVAVTSDRPVYRTRERARIKISVRTADGAIPPPGSEVAVAAVDEGLLELAPNGSWSVLDAMMRRRAYGVETATAQGQVVGKRHFGRKAVPQGGSGGRQPTRELFDTLLFWKGRLPLDVHGEATVEVPLNDSITAFRITAVATGGVSLFGTGGVSIRATQDLMVLPGIAPVAREGDRMRSEVTLRNATERPMQVRVAGRVDRLGEGLAPRDVTLAAGEAQTIGWDVTVPLGVASLGYEIEAAEHGAPAGAAPVDRVRVTQRVVPAVPPRVYQATLDRWERPLKVVVERPAGALPGVGGIVVSLRPTLTEGLGGVRDWMARYPYTCLEQQVSMAVALRDGERWRRIVAALPAHTDGDGLFKYFPAMTEGSATLTAYILSIADEAGVALPPDVTERAVAGLTGFVKGALVRREPLPTVDLSLRKLAALEALSRHGKADPALLGSVAIEPTLWPTSAVLDWWSLLWRVPALPQRAARLREAEQILRARLTVQGTTLGFSTERSDALWWLMVSGDVNATRLVLQLLDTGQWKDEVPRLLRGALARQKQGRWDLTVANAWGALAVEKFSRAYETTPVTGATTATLGGTTRRIDWQATPKGASATLPWPAAREELAVDHAGTGNAWVTVQAEAAVPPAAPVSSGYGIVKRVTLLEPARAGEARAPGQWRRGDLVRVRLDLEAQADMTWVVVNDPIPAGASHVGAGLARDSAIARAGDARGGRAWAAFEERGFESFRAYYAYVPKGAWSVEYTLRLNQSGRFQLPATRVEALYSPEAFGESPNAALEVTP